MSTKTNQPTAGSAEPNWFEWLHGLGYVAELLDPDSEIESVAFQIVGVKGWDDVGARYRDGRIELMQMKHSRVGDTLTFGDLVGTEDDEPSLIASLASAWNLIRDSNPQLKCILITNRRAGPNWYRNRPPLEAFLNALRSKLPNATSLADIVWDGDLNGMKDAWREFTGQLAEVAGKEIEFLRCLEIKPNQADLSELAERLDVRLGELTGLPLASISELRNALISQLHIWTCNTQRESEWIDARQLRRLLLGHEREPAWIGHCDVETPNPFFESRNDLIQDIGKRVVETGGPNCFFLSAEPGAGKTSCISKIVRNAPERWRDQPISLRFYAYRPIVPGRTHFGGDVNEGVTPEALWLGLLWQLRNFLKITHSLQDFRAPVWLHGLSWQQARAHVLRIGSEIGCHWERPFVIAVDGIDHAARARRKGILEFLDSLPSPEALPDSVHLLLAGQPVDAYPEYPNWILRNHPAVEVFPMNELADGDVRILWESAERALAAELTDSIVRILVNFGQRRTLPTVYAVEDIKHSSSLGEAEAILKSRGLSDSLHSYYDGIWSAVVRIRDHFLGPTLAATFAFLRERPTPGLMQLAFHEFEKSYGEWEAILRALRPLVRETENGFEVVHNDFRVYLDGKLSSDPESRRSAASRLANYYRLEQANRLAAHQTLVSLLREAGRIEEFADDFDTSWVVESGAVGILGDELADQCRSAFHSATQRRDWLLLHRVACASLTVHRLNECLSNAPMERSESTQISQTFLPKEGDTIAFELWLPSDVEEIVYAAEALSKAGEESRARLLLEQWFGSRTVVEILQKFVASENDELEERHVGIDRHNASYAMKGWGAVVGRLRIAQHIGVKELKELPDKLTNGIAAFEEGWVKSWLEQQDRDFALHFWEQFRPRFLASWEIAIRGSAARNRWDEVRKLLTQFETTRGSLSHATQIEFCWFALRAGIPKTSSWHEISSDLQFDFGSTERVSLALIIPIARIIGFREPLREPAQVSEDLSTLLNRRQYEDRYLSSSRLILRAAVQIGRLWSYIDRQKEGINSILRFEELEPLLNALWANRPDWRTLPHEDFNLASRIGGELAETIRIAGCYDRTRISDLAQNVFLENWGSDVGKRAFEVIFEQGDQRWLKDTVSDLICKASSNLHTYSYTERPAVVESLKEFADRFEGQDSDADLNTLLRRTRIGYSSHKEYAFGPLCSWLELAIKTEPAIWKSDGLRVLRLDQLSSNQSADNRYDDWIHRILGEAAIECGANDLEALWLQFECKREGWGGLTALQTAVRGGFEQLLKRRRPMSAEFYHSLLALYLSLGRWPSDSALNAIDEVGAVLSSDSQSNVLLNQSRSIVADFSAQPHVGSDRGVVESPLLEKQSADSEELLRRIRSPEHSGWIRLSDLAALLDAVKDEDQGKRTPIIDEALAHFRESSALSRCLDAGDHRVAEGIYRNLNEDERWRLLEILVDVIGPTRVELYDADWAFAGAFNVVNLLCLARATSVSAEFHRTACNQLIETHEVWAGHPSFREPPQIEILIPHQLWPDLARNLLIRQLESDGCEPVYSAMVGLRYLTEIYPNQIPATLERGVSSQRKRDAILSLSKVWATRHPSKLLEAEEVLKEVQEKEALYDRLHAWIVSGLAKKVLGRKISSFSIPECNSAPAIFFPGDDGLLTDTAHVDGLKRHNSFAAFTEEKLRRLEFVLGDLSVARRNLAVAFRNGTLNIPSSVLGAPDFLAFDGHHPRPIHNGDIEFGDAVLRQFAGRKWGPGVVGGVCGALGSDIDPWIATAYPADWPHVDAWPDSHDIERWIENGQSCDDPIPEKLNALVSGDDLPDGMIVLGAVLTVPTYRRDLEYKYWLEESSRSPEMILESESITFFSRNFSTFFGGWDCRRVPNGERTSVHFAGTMIQYPNTDLEVTPTNMWARDWNWRPNPQNMLKWTLPDGAPAARFEQWKKPGQDSISSGRVYRRSLLRRWVGFKVAFPFDFDGLNGWRRRTVVSANLLNRPM